MANFVADLNEMIMAKYLYFLENMAGEILACDFIGVFQARSYCWLLQMDGVQDDVTSAVENNDIRICKYDNTTGKRTYYDL